ncbi:hypothetical protein [Halovenus marina]|uniref:hypothetical protein n=1 Tax=Halovenus marina TaxID=3396621 RepID=UPI003F560DC2
MSPASDDSTPETGLLPGRLEWAVEPSRGVFPTDPDWQYFSDAVRDAEFEPGASLGRQDALGTPDALDHNRGTEEPSASIEYDLQRFPVTVNFESPEIVDSASAVGIASSDAGDTDIPVTIYAHDGTSETITTDGSDGTTFISGSTTFATIQRVEVGSSLSGTITVSIDNSGSAGTALGTTDSQGTTEAVVPNDPSGYGLVRDQHNRLPGSLCIVYRRKYPGGNDDAGVREYTVVRGAVPDTNEPDLDPSSEQPILWSMETQPVKVRSYLIHQLSSAETLSVSSTESSADSGLTVTVEADDGTSEDISMGGTGSTSFQNIDAVFIDDNPEGEITIEGSSSSTVVCEIEGGLTYSDDSQAVDGDRGVPATGTGSHASEIGTSFEHFVGDRFERPSGSAVRPRVNSAGWSVENNTETSSLHSTRLPAVDEGNRAVSVDADIGGEYVSHNSMLESLQKEQHNLEHELSGGLVVFPNAVPTDSATRSVSADQAVASMSETFEPSGQPMIQFSQA